MSKAKQITKKMIERAEWAIHDNWTDNYFGREGDFDVPLYVSLQTTIGGHKVEMYYDIFMHTPELTLDGDQSPINVTFEAGVSMDTIWKSVVARQSVVDRLEENEQRDEPKLKLVNGIYRLAD